MKRGDVVIIDFPFSDRTKVLPSLVVQSDKLNTIRDDTVLAIITSMSSGRPDTEILIEVTDEPGSGSSVTSAKNRPSLEPILAFKVGQASEFVLRARRLRNRLFPEAWVRGDQALDE
jgi:mRNA-degrading endonuclease toxin of MazEF toxin-antitoxin module